MYLTDYHTQYFAYELTKRYASDSLEKLAGAVAGAQVDLNPHQVDAALFAFTSPLSKGALLADEVGLGKTIEAGLVIAQKWAERKRQILVITPANLRKQWLQELSEKFFLPCTILESSSYHQAIKQGNFRPFDSNATVIICSYQFARSKAADVHALPWDLVVIDEAHRLRNVYKSSNVIANTLKKALADRHKLLLTATPLQNSLLELYGLVSFIDEHVFGDLQSFRDQFANLSQAQSFQRLQERLRPICHRTLRRQVLAYIPYTERHPLVEEFTPDESEDRLYRLVSDYLQRPNLQALPAGQRSLMTLVLRKLLASSSFAIAGALTTIATRLKAKLHKGEPAQALAADLAAELAEEYEALDEIADEIADEWDAAEETAEPLSQPDRAALAAEIADLEEFTRLATAIDHNAKGQALLKALDVAFAKAAHLGAAQKAIIFTESRRTQSYLLRLLADSPYAEGIVLFNGSNADDGSKQIYNAWLKRHEGTDRVTGSRTADMRSALVDYFRESGRIMIATEAGAEGINLQFCSLVVNYDLPWNPQRIEQRIGRCHRYGQKHDVVVVNFLNRKNEADKRVFELLSEKFQLFAGVFGASDEVLGAIESGVDFEKRIAEIYQRCRQPAEIKAAFDQLQAELSQEIDAAMMRTRQQLLENFDDEVREKLKVRDEASKAQLNHVEQRLLQLTRHELQQHAVFLPDGAFRLLTQPFPASRDIPLGRYELPRRSGAAHLYRLQHPLAEALLAQAKQRTLPPAAITFRYADHTGKVTILEPLLGQQGFLSLTLLSVTALDQAEDHLLFAAVTDAGQPLDEEACRRLFSLPAQVDQVLPALGLPPAVTVLTNQAHAALIQKISARNSHFFAAELKKLDAWADDQLAGAEKALKDLKKRIRDLRNEASKAPDLHAQAARQSEISELERRQRKLRQEIFDVEDRIVAQRDALVAAVRGKLQQAIQQQTLFTLRWSLPG